MRGSSWDHDGVTDGHGAKLSSPSSQDGTLTDARGVGGSETWLSQEHHPSSLSPEPEQSLRLEGVRTPARVPAAALCIPAQTSAQCLHLTQGTCGPDFHSLRASAPNGGSERPAQVLPHNPGLPVATSGVLQAGRRPRQPPPHQQPPEVECGGLEATQGACPSTCTCRGREVPRGG